MSNLSNIGVLRDYRHLKADVTGSTVMMSCENCEEFGSCGTDDSANDRIKDFIISHKDCVKR